CSAKLKQNLHALVPAHKVACPLVPHDRDHIPELLDTPSQCVVFRVARLQVLARVVWSKLDFTNWYRRNLGIRFHRPHPLFLLRTTRVCSLRLDMGAFTTRSP